MFLNKQPIEKQADYAELLRIVGSLSNLFSESDKPYLDYRITENLFCLCLEAKNLSRSDCSADASKNELGIGIKTFTNTPRNYSMQKVAEFNKLRSEYDKLDLYKMLCRISALRNERIRVTKNMCGLSDIIYHCIIRDVGKIHIVESKMEEVDISSLASNDEGIFQGNNVFYFNDGINEYSFNISKSVLYKRFDTDNILCSIDVDIIDNPYNLLRDLLGDKALSDKNKPIFTNKEPSLNVEQYIFLPLYSIRGGLKYVPEKSGLNQWNAGGRARNENEIYIPIPQKIHDKSPGFFPNRDVPFNLELPDGEILSAKVCQDNNKALMSNPNRKLGEWLLRHVLELKEGELVTYELLSDLGIDSVIITKTDDMNYKIDFTSAGKYETFIIGGD